MAKYSKFNIVYLLQKWMDSVAGQTFMNYAYSWGASVVILGTLFKLTHLPGANTMLFIGMGTEVFVFFISAFDRPFDKTTDGMNLASDEQLQAQLAQAMGDEEVPNPNPFPVSGQGSQIVSGEQGDESNLADGVSTGVVGTGVVGNGVVGGGGIVFAGGGNVVAGGSGVATEGTEIPEGTDIEGVAGTTGVAGGNGPVVIGGGNFGPTTPAPAVSQETAEAMEKATSTYVDRLNELNETLTKVAALSERLSVDSEEMENLNRTLTGIARVYEMQLKSASQQITTQDEINEQTRRMAQQITELNGIYTRMIEAMTVNMNPLAAAKAQQS